MTSTASAASTPECDETDDVTEPFAAANLRRKDSLTFGEFCLFATELRKYYRNHEAAKAAANNGAAGGGSGAAGGTGPCGGPEAAPTAPSEKPPSERQPCGEGAAQSSSSKLKTQKSSSSSPSYDVFLGGSCGATTWRADVAVPYLRAHGITFFNPQQSNWVPEMIELEHQAKQTSSVVLMVLSEQTRNVVSMIECAHLAGARR